MQKIPFIHSRVIPAVSLPSGLKPAGIVTCVQRTVAQQMLSVRLCYSVHSVLKKVMIEISDNMSVLQHPDTEARSYTEKGGYDQ